MEHIPDDNISRIVREQFENKLIDNYILIGEEKTCLPERYLNFAEAIDNFEVRNSDVIVCAYPKAGTTWTQEMVWLIMSGLDYEGAIVQLSERFPYLEVGALGNFEKMNNTVGTKYPEYVSDSIEYTRRQKEPRFIKTHLPFSLLPQQVQNGCKLPKIIYVTRNPKDVCVSYYHHGKTMQGRTVNFGEFSQVFLAEKVLYGSYWKHVLGFWHQRSLPNLLIIAYEDMKKDLRSVIDKVASFLNKPLREEQIDKLCKHLDFESMKHNKAVNHQDHIESNKKVHVALEDGKFMRSGVVGNYKEEMSVEIIEQFDAWTKEYTEAIDFVNVHGYNSI